MQDTDKTKKQLIQELEAARKRIAALEQAAPHHADNHTPFQRFADQSQDMLYRMSLPDGRYEFVSAAVTELSGYTPDEWLHNPLIIQKIIPPEWRNYFAEQWDHLLHGEVPDFYEYQILTKNGELKWVNQRNTLIKDKQGRPKAIEGIVTDINERKQAEEELTTIFRMSLDLICTADINTYTFLKVNPAFETVLGYPEETFLNQPFLNFIHPDDVEPTNRLVDEQLKAGHKVLHFENRYRTVDGDYRWLDWTSHPIPEKGITFAIARDITDRKRMEEELRKERLKLETYFNLAGVMFVLLNPDGSIALINPKACDVLGCKKEKIEGQNWFDRMIPESNREAVREVFTKIVSGDLEPVEFYENPVITHHGEERLIAWHNAMVTDQDGRITQILSSGEDITDRKKAEEILRDSERRFRLLVQNSNDIIQVMDKDGTIIYISEQLEKILGYKPKELMGQSGFIGVHPDDLQEIARIFAEALLKPHSTDTAEFRYRHKKGHWVELEAIGTNLLHDPSINGIVLNVRDISERKRTREALEKRVIALTQPLSDTNGVQFEDLFNLEEIQRLQDEFSEATGVAARIFKPDGTPITKPSNFCRLCNDIIRKTEKGAINCRKSDIVIGQYNPEGPIFQPCLSGGLWDAGATISVEGTHIASWLVGQVRDETQTEERIRAYAKEIGANETDIVEAFHEVPTMSRQQFEKIAQVLSTLAKQLSTTAYQNVQQARFISDRKQAENALRDSEERLTLALNATNDGLWDWNIETNSVYFSPQYYRMLGYQPDEMLASFDTWLNLLHPDDRQEAQASVQHHLENKTEAFSTEFRMQMKNGDWLWILARGKIVERDENGKPLRMVGTHTSISERKKAEAALEKTQAILTAAISQSPTGILIADAPDVKIRYANPAALAIRGQTDITLTGIDVTQHSENWQVFHSDGVTPYKPEELPLSQAISDGLISNNVEMVICSDTGDKRLILVNAGPVFDKNNRIVSAIAILHDITDQKRAEGELRESEKKFRSIAEQSTDMITLTDGFGNLTYASPASKALFHAQPEEMVGRHFLEFVYEDDLQKARASFQGVVGDDRPEINLDIRLKRIDGTVFHSELNANPHDIGGQTGTIVMIRDISERKMAENELRESEEKFRSIAEQSTDMIALTDENGVITYTSPASVILFATQPEEMVGRHFLEFLHEEDLPIALAAFHEAMETNQPTINLELRMKRTDGRIFHGELNGSPRKAGGQAGTLVMIRDISERKTAEEQLRDSENRFRTLFEYSPQLIALTDVETGVYTEVNRKFCEVLKLTRDEIIDHPSPQFFFDNREKQNDFFRELFKTGKLDGKELTAKIKDGTSIILLVFARLIQVGPKQHILIMAMDITQQKKLEDQFRQSQKMEAIGRLAGGVAHDFNNLLTGISGNIALATMDLSASDPLFETFTEIEQAADRATALTRQLLAFSRKQIITPEIVNLNDLIRSLGRMLHRIIGEDIELKTILSKSIGQIKADPGQIEQIIVNLSVNARDAMPKGGKLSIETYTAELDAEYCLSHTGATEGRKTVLAISDTGHGIEKQHIANIFEPFYTTKPKGQGTGLGLSMVYGMIKQHEGSIEVYSETEHGTTFRIYFPQVNEKVAVNKTPAKPDRQPGGSETILLVEDEKMVRNIATKILKKLGYFVLSAENGAEGVHVSEAHGPRIDLLLTDVIMPGKNGRQLAEELLAKRPEMKVLFTSGYTENVIAHHGVLDPGVDFIGKPYTPSSLAQKVRDILDRQS